MTDTRPVKVCMYCAAPIADSATFCPHCQRSQNKWRNELVFLGSIFSVISLAISGIVFIYEENKYWALDYLPWTKDVLNVTAFMEYDNIAIYNDGFRPITLLEIEIKSHELQRTALYEINETIPVNNVVSRDDIGGKRKVQMATIDDNLLASAARDGSVEAVIPVAAIPEDRDYIFRRDGSDGDPVLFDCQGTLHYVPYGENEVHQQTFDCVYFAAFTPHPSAWFAIREEYRQTKLLQEAQK